MPFENNTDAEIQDQLGLMGITAFLSFLAGGDLAHEIYSIELQRGPDRDEVLVEINTVGRDEPIVCAVNGERKFVVIPTMREVELKDGEE